MAGLWLIGHHRKLRYCLLGRWYLLHRLSARQIFRNRLWNRDRRHIALGRQRLRRSRSCLSWLVGGGRLGLGGPVSMGTGSSAFASSCANASLAEVSSRTASTSVSLPPELAMV